MSDDKHHQDLAAQIKEYHQIGEFDKALEISAGALESNPADLEAYGSRWKLVADMFPEEEAKRKIRPEIESLLQTNTETQELLNTAYWGYRGLAGQTMFQGYCLTRCCNTPEPKFIRVHYSG